MSRIRILRLLPELDFGGVESRLVLQAALHDRAAFDLHVATFHKPGAAAERLAGMGVPVHVLGEHPRVRNVRATAALHRLLRQLRPAVAHASIVEANFHLLLAATTRPTMRVIVEETGMPAHGMAARTAFRVLYRRASRVVGVSRAVCDYLERVDHAPADRVALVYNCAAPAYFPEKRRAASPRANGLLRALLVGRLVPVKNHEVVLQAVAEASRAGIEIRVTIVGDGPRRVELEGIIAAQRIGHLVHLAGFRDDVRALLEEHDVFLLPSHSEGCSVSLVEAMATGTDVLGSTAAGIREVLGELAAECCVPATDVEGWTAALMRLSREHSGGRESRVARLQARAYSAFSPDVYMSNVEGSYRDLVHADAHSGVTLRGA